MEKNNTGNYRFTVIVPIYNEQDNIYELERRLSAYLPKCVYSACALFINDGSTDRSGEMLKEICSRNNAFFYMDFAANAGLSAAIKAGFDYAQSEYVGYMDADLQTAPEDFDLLLADISGYSMVTGIRADRKDSFFKNLQSRIANGFRRMMTHDGATDTGCPLKVLRTDCARKIPMFKGMHRFLPALVLLQDGATYRQVPVRHFPRVAGRSKFNLWNRLWGPFSDCFAYRWMKSRYINYSVKDSNI